MALSSRGVIGALVVVSVVAGLVAATAQARPMATAPIVTVIRQGGLCVPGMCRSVLKIDDTTISGDGYRPRRLEPNERRSLLRAVAKLELSYFRKHPFTGTCPTAYDASEAVYRFRGFVRALPSCTYDLRGVEAVRLTEQLLRSLKPRGS